MSGARRLGKRDGEAERQAAGRGAGRLQRPPERNAHGGQCNDLLQPVLI
jgi:hypothetical protein